MKTSDFLGFLKDITPLLSAFLGVLGVFNVFKSTGGKLTRWGWSAVVIIIATAISSVITSKIDDSKNQKDKEKMQENFNAILMNLNRVNHPVRGVDLTALVILPDDNNEVIRLKRKVKEAIKSLPKQSYKSDWKKSPLESTFMKIDGTVINYDIRKGGSLWPDHNYPILSGMLLTYRFNICVKRKPINPKDFKYIQGDFGSYDWCTHSYMPNDENNSLTYDVELDKIVLFSKVKFKAEDIKDNGAFTSTDDLPGSQLFFIPPYKDMAFMAPFLKSQGVPDGLIKSELESSVLYKKIKLKSITLSFKPYRELNLSSADFKKLSFNDHFFYYMVIPKE
ncbi:hypothetical protein [Pantoea agglomerans]|uniref:hypothetical protein n=1 Tax=Enterobacter agglomerans TaxID=549 RepID=UPI00301BF4A8